MRLEATELGEGVDDDVDGVMKRFRLSRNGKVDDDFSKERELSESDG